MRAAIATFVLLWIVGCSRPSVPARPPQAPLPSVDGVTRSSSVFRAGDGVELFEQCWRPTARAPRAVMVVVHGIKDHSARYHELATNLAGAGYVTCGFDHRGHGRSGGPRFAIHSFDQVLNDIDRYLALVRERFADTPVILFGHSMGAVLVPQYVIERRPPVAGVILSATALRPHIHPIEIAGLRVVAGIFPNAPLLDAPTHTFSPDPAVQAAMRADPLIDQGRGTGRMALELSESIRRVWARAEAIDPPLLLLHGTADRATNPRGSIELHRRAGAADKTLKLYPGAGHDLAHDPLRARITGDILSWLATHPRR